MPVKSDVKQRLFTYSETSKILNRSEVSIWRDVKDGRLVAVKIGGSTRITGESIERAIAGEAPNPPQQPHPFSNAGRQRKAARATAAE
jgi:Helix-turn-helix domain